MDVHIPDSPVIRESSTVAVVTTTANAKVYNTTQTDNNFHTTLLSITNSIINCFLLNAENDN